MISIAHTRKFFTAALVGLLAFATTTGTQAQDVRPAKVETNAIKTLTIDIAEIQKPWIGDLDGMSERGFIRVLTVNSKTIYFLDKGVQRGTAVDYARLFEEELNKKLIAEKKL
jgi:hypothetical protein